jgi:hypothetical protein
VKVHRVELLIVDTDDLGANSVAEVIENVRYPNHCIAPRVVNVDTREVDFDDDHPLNCGDTWLAEFRRLFGGT